MPYAVYVREKERAKNPWKHYGSTVKKKSAVMKTPLSLLFKLKNLLDGEVQLEYEFRLLITFSNSARSKNLNFLVRLAVETIRDKPNFRLCTTWVELIK